MNVGKRGLVVGSCASCMTRCSTSNSIRRAIRISKQSPTMCLSVGRSRRSFHILSSTNCDPTRFWCSPSPTRNGVPTTGCDEDECSVGQHHHGRHGQRVERLVLYWTAEEKKAHAVMEFPSRIGQRCSKRPAGTLMKSWPRSKPTRSAIHRPPRDLRQRRTSLPLPIIAFADWRL